MENGRRVKGKRGGKRIEGNEEVEGNKEAARI